MIAITGAGGYLGGRLCATLTGSGVRVRRLTREPDLAAGDAAFALDQPVAADSLAGVEVLIHAAHDFRPTSEVALRRINLDGSRRLLEAAKHAGVRRIVFISSLAAYEDCRSVYGRVKCEIEREVAAAGGMSLRPGTVYGHPAGGLFAALERAAGALPLLPDFGDRARLSLVHLADLTRVIERLVAGEVAPTVLVVAHPESVSFRGVLEALAQSVGRHPGFVAVPPALAMLGLRSLEVAGIHPPFRSDSLIGLLHRNPEPELSAEVLGIPLRAFTPAALAAS